MTRRLSFAFVIAATVAATSAAFAEEPVKPLHHRHPAHSHSHHPAQPSAIQHPVPAQTPQSAGSVFKPYAHPGDGDDDGISTDPDDCMKGCIGGNPG